MLEFPNGALANKLSAKTELALLIVLSIFVIGLGVAVNEILRTILRSHSDLNAVYIGALDNLAMCAVHCSLAEIVVWTMYRHHVPKVCCWIWIVVVITSVLCCAIYNIHTCPVHDRPAIHRSDFVLLEKK